MMARATLKKLGSFEGYGIRATTEKPVVDNLDIETAQSLEATGYFDVDYLGEELETGESFEGEDSLEPEDPNEEDPVEEATDSTKESVEEAEGEPIQIVRDGKKRGGK